MISFLVLLRRFRKAFAALVRDPETRPLPVLAIVLLLTGTIFYSQAEDWSVADALYFSVTSLLTVGMGDLVPTTTGSKLFTVLYLLVGVGVLVAFATAIGQKLIEERRLDRPAATRDPGR
jgi:voltage-gated potassium channel